MRNFPKVIASAAMFALFIVSAPAQINNPGGGSGGSGTVSNCSTPGGIAVYASTGTVIGCASGVTATNTTLSLAPGVSFTLPDGSVDSSTGFTALISPIIAPSADSTTALQITKADKATRIVDIDSTNARVGINKTPGAFDLDVNGASNFTGAMTIAASAISLNLTSATASLSIGNSRAVLTAPITNNLQFGAADISSTPPTQTIRAQSASGGSNTPGAIFSIVGSRSTGTGIGGDIVLQTSQNVAGATSQNAVTTAITLKAATQETIFGAPARLAGYTVSTLPAGNTGDMAYVTDAVACTFLGALTGSGTTVCKVWFNGTAWLGG